MESLYDEMKLLGDVGFREIYKKFMYIDCRELLDLMLPGELDESITGIFAYCYIDQDEGISFRPILLAVAGEETVQVFTFPHQEDTIYILRLRGGETKMSEVHDGDSHMYLYALDPKKYSFIELSVLGIDTDEFADFKQMIDETYDPFKMVEELRSEEYSYLDKYRHEAFPDDVKVILYKEDIGGEQVWVRMAFITQDGAIFGKLLNEPYHDFGCHEGTLIELTEMKAGEDSLLVFTGRTAELK